MLRRPRLVVPAVTLRTTSNCVTPKRYLFFDPILPAREGVPPTLGSAVRASHRRTVVVEGGVCAQGTRRETEQSQASDNHQGSDTHVPSAWEACTAIVAPHQRADSTVPVLAGLPTWVAEEYYRQRAVEQLSKRDAVGEGGTAPREQVEALYFNPLIASVDALSTGGALTGAFDETLPNLTDDSPSASLDFRTKRHAGAVRKTILAASRRLEVLALPQNKTLRRPKLFPRRTVVKLWRLLALTVHHHPLLVSLNQKSTWKRGSRRAKQSKQLLDRLSLLTGTLGGQQRQNPTVGSKGSTNTTTHHENKEPRRHIAKLFPSIASLRKLAHQLNRRTVVLADTFSVNEASQILYWQYHAGASSKTVVGVLCRTILQRIANHKHHSPSLVAWQGEAHDVKQILSPMEALVVCATLGHYSGVPSFSEYHVPAVLRELQPLVVDALEKLFQQHHQEEGQTANLGGESHWSVPNLVRGFAKPYSIPRPLMGGEGVEATGDTSIAPSTTGTVIQGWFESPCPRGVWLNLLLRSFIAFDVTPSSELSHIVQRMFVLHLQPEDFPSSNLEDKIKACEVRMKGCNAIARSLCCGKAIGRVKTLEPFEKNRPTLHPFVQGLLPSLVDALLLTQKHIQSFRHQDTQSTEDVKRLQSQAALLSFAVTAILPLVPQVCVAGGGKGAPTGGGQLARSWMTTTQLALLAAVEDALFLQSGAREGGAGNDQLQEGDPLNLAGRTFMNRLTLSIHRHTSPRVGPALKTKLLLLNARKTQNLSPADVSGWFSCAFRSSLSTERLRPSASKEGLLSFEELAEALPPEVRELVKTSSGETPSALRQQELHRLGRVFVDHLSQLSHDGFITALSWFPTECFQTGPEASHSAFFAPEELQRIRHRFIHDLGAYSSVLYAEAASSVLPKLVTVLDPVDASRAVDRLKDVTVGHTLQMKHVNGILQALGSYNRLAEMEGLVLDRLFGRTLSLLDAGKAPISTLAPLVSSLLAVNRMSSLAFTKLCNHFHRFCSQLHDPTAGLVGAVDKGPRNEGNTSTGTDNTHFYGLEELMDVLEPLLELRLAVFPTEGTKFEDCWRVFRSRVIMEAHVLPMKTALRALNLLCMYDTTDDPSVGSIAQRLVAIASTIIEAESARLGERGQTMDAEDTLVEHDNGVFAFSLFSRLIKQAASASASVGILRYIRRVLEEEQSHLQNETSSAPIVDKKFLFARMLPTLLFVWNEKKISVSHEDRLLALPGLLFWMVRMGHDPQGMVATAGKPADAFGAFLEAVFLSGEFYDILRRDLLGSHQRARASKENEGPGVKDVAPREEGAINTSEEFPVLHSEYYIALLVSLAGFRCTDQELVQLCHFELRKQLKVLDPQDVVRIVLSTLSLHDSTDHHEMEMVLWPFLEQMLRLGKRCHPDDFLAIARALWICRVPEGGGENEEVLNPDFPCKEKILGFASAPQQSKAADLPPNPLARALTALEDEKRFGAGSEGGQVGRPQAERKEGGSDSFVELSVDDLFDALSH